MELKKRRRAFLFVWALLVLASPLTLLSNANIERVFSNDFLALNLFQRVFGLIAFTLLASQIVLGSLMDKWVKHFGGWTYKFHVTEGIFTYALVLLHPFMQTIIDFKVGGIAASLLTFLPGKDIYLNFGKLGFTLITLSFIAGYFRTKPFFRKNWKKFHILSYFAFYFSAYHAWVLGTDTKQAPFMLIFWVLVVSVTVSALSRAWLLIERGATLIKNEGTTR